MKTIARNASLLTMTMLAGTAAAQPTWYTMQEIVPPAPTSMGINGNGINDYGEVVGEVWGPNMQTKPFIWLPVAKYGYPAGFNYLDMLGGEYGEAKDINNAGQVCGRAGTPNAYNVARWDLATGSTPLVWHTGALASKINASGIIGGHGLEVPGGPCGKAAVFTGLGGGFQIAHTACANSIVTGINAGGLVAGDSHADFTHLAFFAAPPLYTASPLPNFPPITGSGAYTRIFAMNDLGQMTASVGHPTLGEVAIVFKDNNGDGVADPATEYTIVGETWRAYAINNHGVIGGRLIAHEVGVVKLGSKLRELNKCVDKRPGGYPFISSVRDINDEGQLICVGTAETGNVVVVLTPQCYANCDGSTGTPKITANDFMCFLNKFAAGHPYANCDESTGTPLLTANDFACFLNQAIVFCP